MNITPAQRRDQYLLRMGVALVVLQKLREALEANGNYYRGTLVPNLTSVSDILTLPWDVFDATIIKHPELVPTGEQLAQLESMLAGTAPRSGG